MWTVGPIEKLSENAVHVLLVDEKCGYRRKQVKLKKGKKVGFFGLPSSSHVNQKLFLTFDCHLILVDVTSWGENTHMVIVCLYFHKIH